MSTVWEMIERLRSEFLDDEIGAESGDSLWSDVDLARGIRWAERQLCRRLHLLVDSTTPDVCQIAVAKADGVYPRSYPLSPVVLAVDRVKYPDVTPPLPQYTRIELDRIDPGWDEKTGIPSAFIVDRGRITFNRQPEADATVALTVVRYPLAVSVDEYLLSTSDISDLEDELLHGALSRVYLKQDGQAFDPQAAARWRVEFESDVRQLVSDRAELTPKTYIMKPERW